MARVDTHRVRRAAGQLEGEVLAVLWAADAPVTPAQVQAELDDLAYNTVHTILTRLTDKDQVSRVLYEGRPAYVPVKDAAHFAADQMRAAMAASPDRQAVLASFVTTLTPEEEAALRSVLRRWRRKAVPPPPVQRGRARR